MSELLFVVERRRPGMYESLKQTCVDVEDVQVVLDRRQQERRRSPARFDRDRRQSERRTRNIDAQLTSLGFAVVKRDLPPHEAFGQSPGAQVAPIHAETAAFLARVPLFSGFSGEEIGQLAARMKRRRLRAGQILFEEGDLGEEMFLVQEGRVLISKEVTGRAEEVLAVIEPGDFFGEMNVFGGLRRSATVRAETDAVLLDLDHANLQHLVERSPRAGLIFFAAMVREFSKRLDRTDDLVAEVTRWGLEATGLDEDFE
ncbi:MAG: cyclic nucleotide-binding domain-containing protein [Candidatus Rokubacteria bacterium]|nr:cyclic nucleotide-binding domain-containing protein [Candidatus Rokubacteria bacterium]